jgi:DNA-binding transcriptional regulator YiaG
MTLEEFKAKSGFTSNPQVAKALELSVHTVNSWSSGRKSPCPWSQLKMEKFLENQNVQKARFAQFRNARQLSSRDLDRVIEDGSY